LFFIINIPIDLENIIGTFLVHISLFTKKFEITTLLLFSFSTFLERKRMNLMLDYWNEAYKALAKIYCVKQKIFVLFLFHVIFLT